MQRCDRKPWHPVQKHTSDDSASWEDRQESERLRSSSLLRQWPQRNPQHRTEVHGRPDPSLSAQSTRSVWSLFFKQANGIWEGHPISVSNGLGRF